MSFPANSVFLLPPRPALRDWPLAGGCGGLLLGLAELAFAAPSTLPAPLAMLAVVSSALVVAFAAALLGFLLHGFGARPSHSALVAWVAGLIGFSAATSLVLPNADTSWLLSIAVLSLLGSALAGATFAAARLADRSERSGIPANALWVWGATAIVIAAGERVCLGATGSRVETLALLAGFVLGGAGIACAGFLIARRRGSSPPRGSFGRLLRLLSLLALATAFAHEVLPWILADSELAPPHGTPAHILILAVGPAAAVPNAAHATGALADWSGIRYAPLVQDPTRAIEALLTLPDGAALVPILASDGYATAAILGTADLAQTITTREVDARPGGRVRLEREFRWLAAAPWLVGPARPALDRLGWGSDARTPAQLASDARAWLLRRSASASPFFLLVDFRQIATHGRAEGAREEEAAVALLDHLDQTGLSERTVVLLVRTGRAHEPPLQVVVRPPLAWARAAADQVVARPVQASEIGAALREIARADGLTPIDFPGVVVARRSRPALALSE